MTDNSFFMFIDHKLSQGVYGNANSIAESDFIWTFKHSFVIIFLK